MKRNELAAVTLYVGLKGATVTCYDENGEVQFVVGYPAGIHSLEKLVGHVGEGHEVDVDGDAYARQRLGRLIAQPYGRHGVETGANPDFQPGRASEAEHQARLLLQRINRQSKALEKRMATFERLSQDRREAVAEPPASEVLEEEPQEVTEREQADEGDKA